MPFQFNCPICGAASEVPDHLAGSSGPCYQCGQTVTLPGGYPTARSGGMSGWAIAAIVVGVLAVAFVALGALLFPAISAARSAARRTQCMNNLKQIGLACHSFNDVTNQFPAAYTVDAQGQPGLSWRVTLLPYVEQRPLFQSIDQTQAWDSARNRPYNSLAPKIYRCPESDSSAAPGLTDYLAVVGPETVFPGAKRSIGFRDIVDGASNTIMLVESTGQNINWMEPRDLAFNQVQLSQLQSDHRGGLNVVLCDGSVRFIRYEDMDDATFKAMLTRAGSEGF